MSRAGDEKRRENAVVEKAEKTWTEKSKKWLTNGGGGCIIFLVSSASVLRAKPNSGDLHSGSAVDSDSTCGSSILSSPTRKPQSQLAAVFSGHSAVGSAPRSGRGGRGFKSRCSDLKKQVHVRVLAFLFSRARDLNSTAAQSAAKKAPVGLSLVRGSQSSGMSIVGDCRFDSGAGCAGTHSCAGLFLSLQPKRPLPAAETGS